MDKDAIRKQLALSLTDLKFSRKEKQDLRSFIAEQELSLEDLCDLRDIAFAMAQDSCDHKAVAWLDGITHVITNHRTQAMKARHSEVLFSPRDDCPARIQSLIRDVKKALNICVFTITDDVITQEIIGAHKRGLEVRVITDNEKAEDRGSDVFRIIDSGVPVALDRDGHMHHKFAVFDGELSITGSYNWTKSAARHNHENILISGDPKVASALNREFDLLWQTYGS